MNRSVIHALLAAVLFGASTPLAKQLVGGVPPLLLGGLLYLGSGLGLTLFRCLRDGGWRATGVLRGEWPWLVGAIFLGGVLAPMALMQGLALTTASSASLLLNLEAVLTAVLAWAVFREHTDRRMVLGMVVIVAGGLLLSWPGAPAQSAPPASVVGPLWIVLACACWALDNNLTRKVSASDAVFVAGCKGLIAGPVACALALGTGAAWPAPALVGWAMLVGLLGYGVSLVMFVLALRGLGTARTGAYFSVAPFVGAAGALLFLGEAASPRFWAGAVLMAWGVWLHLTERHEHEHQHEALEHSHRHVHDEHHQHAHPLGWSGEEPHEHPHVHTVLTHRHLHYPDIHHRHAH